MTKKEWKKRAKKAEKACEDLRADDPLRPADEAAQRNEFLEAKLAEAAEALKVKETEIAGMRELAKELRRAVEDVSHKGVSLTKMTQLAEERGEIIRHLEDQIDQLQAGRNGEVPREVLEARQTIFELHKQLGHASEVACQNAGLLGEKDARIAELENKLEVEFFRSGEEGPVTPERIGGSS